jgi:putative phosphotransacetylase
MDEVTKTSIDAELRTVFKDVPADSDIPVAVSARHIHLDKHSLEVLFGIGYSLTKDFDLLQPGEFAAKERVTIAGIKGSLSGVRVLGPLREKTQVEVSKTDAINLGVDAKLRLSGNLEDSSGINVIGPSGSIILSKGLIIAKRHLHCSTNQAKKMGIKDGQIVWVRFDAERDAILGGIVVRLKERGELELHLDTDEANTVGLKKGDKGYLVFREDISNSEKKNDIIREAPYLITEELLKRAVKEGFRIRLGKKHVFTPSANELLRFHPDLLIK